MTLNYQAKNGETYELSLIDTPGHVDFAYEVSRSLAACEAAMLVVDAAQGVEAQTVSVCYLALEQDLEIFPVLNKIDLPQAEPERVCKEIEEMIGLDTSDTINVSGKTGIGIDSLLESVIKKVPAPVGDINKPLQALIIDSWFDPYLGVVSLIRIKEGKITKGDKVQVFSTGKVYTAEEIGVFSPKRTSKSTLSVGSVGYLIANVKDIEGVPVGDTITFAKNGALEPLSGFQKVKPLVYAGLFPSDSGDFVAFREALQKLKLNDASLIFEPESSDALGFGFRCGFLGMLHMEIIQERLEQEYDMDLITTAPTVAYQVTTKKDGPVLIDNPSELPSPNIIESMQEPIAEANIYTPQEYVGAIMKICIDKRGVQKNMAYAGNQVHLTFEIPMNEIVLDFFDKIKSSTKGYASLDYNFIHYQTSPLVKLDFMVNGERIDALSTIVHKDRSTYIGRALTKKLKELIPRQMFQIAIQAAIGGHIIARETVSALKKM